MIHRQDRLNIGFRSILQGGLAKSAGDDSHPRRVEVHEAQEPSLPLSP